MNIIKEKESVIVLIFLLLLSVSGFSQKSNNNDSWEGIYFQKTELSPVEIAADRNLGIEDLMKIIQKDSSLFESFRNLKNFKFISNNTIKYLVNNKPIKKENILLQHFHKDTLTYREKIKHSTEILDEEAAKELAEAEGILFELFQSDTFKINKSKQQELEKLVKEKEDQEKLANMSENKKTKYMRKKAKAKEKEFNFNFIPSDTAEGSQFTNLPFVGNRLAIFEPEMQIHYNFKMSRGSSKNGEEGYIFLAVPKKPNKEVTIIKRLEVFLAKENLSILGYSLDGTYKSFIYDVDLKLNVNCRKENVFYVPNDLRIEADIDVILLKAFKIIEETHYYNFTLEEPNLE